MAISLRIRGKLIIICVTISVDRCFVYQSYPIHFMKATGTWGSPPRDGDQGRRSNILLSGHENSGKNAIDRFFKNIFPSSRDISIQRNVNGIKNGSLSLNLW